VDTRSDGGMQGLIAGAANAARLFDRLLGGSTIRDLSEFVASFEGMTEAFRDRAAAMRVLLHGPETRFFLVATPTRSHQEEAASFHTFIRQHGFPFGGFLVNQVAVNPSANPQ